MDIGGGAWRVKWHPDVTRRNDLLVACMHGGYKVLHITPELGGLVNGNDPGCRSYETLTRMDEDCPSLAYGADWSFRPDDTATGTLAGQNEVHVKNLPNGLDEDSIRVEGLENATIFDVIYKPPRPAASYEQDAKLRTSKKQLAALQSEKTILEDQSGFLDEYAKTLGADKAGGMSLDQFLKLYGDEKKRITKELADLEDKLEAAKKDVEDGAKRLAQDDQGKKRTTQVNVIVLADSDGQAELSLWYVVEGASWTPLYDLRAMLPAGQDTTHHSTSKSTTPSNVSLHYRASISQTTGEDWSSVDLTLSTASPHTDSTIPTIQSWRVGVKPPAGRTMQTARKSTGGAMRHRRILTRESTTSMSFTIEGKSNIPSVNGSSDDQIHKVMIAVIDLTAKLEWVAMPKEKESAFLRDVSPQEMFTASLGVDPSIRVTYHPLSKKTKTYTGGLGSFLALQTKADVTSNVQRFTIKNNRGTRVSPLIIRDHVPVSVDSVVKVIVNEPKELSEVKERKEIDITAGVKARWSHKGQGEEGTGGGVEEEGVVEWVCDLDAGKSIDLALAYDLILPSGQTWVSI
ncbi:hypothetical protein FRB98_004449 [Tulasnella sp. 332]|nr:hypothetical protein FRB98_004449 [Tulasnella sp. 332]